MSIVVPVYNAGRKLEKCIRSILKSTEKDIELILVDDGSTDGSGAVCEKYARRDSRVCVFHQENGGSMAARRIGVERCTGEFTLFCDADDLAPGRYLAPPELYRRWRCEYRCVSTVVGMYQKTGV
ncbi:MAG TPA: glycosyltransferase family 2 protein, partial [Candidatus Intestinimonas stercoravium]|nr:glycosyltransferase family 2 protein [Candidatus Intestinimonas stercoravium]